MEEISKRYDISSSIIFAKIVAIRKILSGDIKMPAEIPKFSNAHFRNILENLLHIFDANLTHFLPEWKIYVSTEKIIGISRGNSWWRQGLQLHFCFHYSITRGIVIQKRGSFSSAKNCMTLLGASVFTVSF